MGFFDKHQKKGHTALKQDVPVIRTETRKDATVSKTPHFVHPVHTKPRNKLLKPRSERRAKSANGVERPSPVRTSSPMEKQRHSHKSASSTPQRQLWADDSEASEQEPDAPRKRHKRQSSVEPDLKRTIRSRKAFSDDGGQFPMIHAADIANSTMIKQYKLAFPGFPDEKRISLQYPSASQRERYELVIPKADDFKSLEDIRETIENIISYYIPAGVADILTNESTGLVRRLKRASQKLAGDEYSKCIQEWNDTLTELRDNGSLESVIDEWEMVELPLCKRILTQTYDRTVSPEVNELRKYKNGEDYVYGELLPKLVSNILKSDTKMKANDVFVDLGSGVGNVVLQAALEVGCESWGCEIQPAACKLAKLQKSEFEARCRLWGLSTGNIHLEEGDFRTDEAIRGVIQRADVVLVNNRAFQPELNEDLTNLFLDLKDGAKVVSLVSFAPVGQQNQSRSAGAIYNILDVSEKKYYDDSVSWTGGDGSYYVATKDSTKVKDFS